MRFGFPLSMLIVGISIGFWWSRSTVIMSPMKSEVQSKSVLSPSISPSPIVPVAGELLTRVDPNKCAPMPSIADQLSTQRFMEIHKTCRDAEESWMKRNLDTYAPFVGSEQKNEQLTEWIENSIARLVVKSRWWKAEAIIRGKDSVEITAFLEYPEKHKMPDSCPNFTVSYLVNGKPPENSGGIFSNCSFSDRRRGDNFFIPVHSYFVQEVAPTAIIILFPAPYNVGHLPLEFYDSTAEKWRSSDNIKWTETTAEEMKAFEKEYWRKLGI